MTTTRAYTASVSATKHQHLKNLAGRFIVFDGPDGSGKSTQFSRFIAACNEAGLTVCDVREPGGTPVGEHVRDILLDPAHKGMDVRCEMLLYMASRAQLVSQRIAPALQRGELVIADRFVSSTLAYQGSGGGLTDDAIKMVADLAIAHHWPDLVVVFDVDEATASRRLSPLLDRMEAKGAAFHARVRKGYLKQVSQNPETHLLIDATKPEDEVFQAMITGICQKLNAMAQGTQ